VVGDQNLKASSADKCEETQAARPPRKAKYAFHENALFNLMKFEAKDTLAEPRMIGRGVHL
jgi:hypothetical protein